MTTQRSLPARPRNVRNCGRDLFLLRLDASGAGISRGHLVRPVPRVASRSVNLAAVLLATAASEPDRPALDRSRTRHLRGARGAGPPRLAAAVREPRRCRRPGRDRRRQRDRVRRRVSRRAAGGGVAVPLNVGSPSHELARELDAVEPVLVVASSANADLARRAVAQPAAAQPAARSDESSEESSQRGIPVVVVDGADPANSSGPIAGAGRGGPEGIGRPRGPAVHRGHRRRAQARDAHARIAAREHRADAVASRACASTPTTSPSACSRSSTSTG